MGREALVQQLASQREAILQACWAHRMWAAKSLRTVAGEPLEVDFPGWLNRGPGPDFTAARLRVGERELFGDVEVHMAEAEWRRHGHADDARYGRVVLHVVLQGSPPRVARSGTDEVIDVFEALPHLSSQVLGLMGEPDAMLRQYENLPGRCGVRAALGPPEALERVVAHAAEVRARHKAERLLPRWKGREEAQLLYELMFRSLGYRPHADAFAELATRFPLAELAPWLELPPRDARREVLARWFGALGLLNGDSDESQDEEARREFDEWRRVWEKLGEPPQAATPRRSGTRPWNSPERRMVGFFHHLHAGSGAGWLKHWLALLRDLDGLRDRPAFRPEALRRLDHAFATPAWEPWRRRITFHRASPGSAARLIGRDRMIVLMANAVLPFFLAYARQRQDDEMEKMLYRLFIVLPPEGSNQRTRFMEKRLMFPPAAQRTLRTHQGLLQIHQDFCTSFYEGCEACGFPDLIPAPE